MPTISPQTAKIKVQLKLSIERLRLLQKKLTESSKRDRRALATLLEASKIESARIRVENVIRTDVLVELYEILELYCELLLARIGLLDAQAPSSPTHSGWGSTSPRSPTRSSRNGHGQGYGSGSGSGKGNHSYIDPGLEEAVVSIVYASPRIEVAELQKARALLMEKFGREFALRATDNDPPCVPERVLKKLRVSNPPEVLVDSYLREIARTYAVDWPKGSLDSSTATGNEDGDGGSGGLKEPVVEKKLEAPLETPTVGLASPPKSGFVGSSPVRVAPPSASTDNIHPELKLPGPPENKPRARTESTGKKTVGGKIPDVDELARRFAALKR